MVIALFLLALAAPAPAPRPVPLAGQNPAATAPAGEAIRQAPTAAQASAPSTASAAPTPEALGAYAAVVRQALANARVPVAGPPRKLLPAAADAPVLTVELRIGADGALRSLVFGPASATGAQRDLGAVLLCAAEPFPPPDAAVLGSRSEVGCLARLSLTLERKKLAAGASVLCFGANGGPGVVAADVEALGAAIDPAAALLAGYAKQAAGDTAAAIELFTRAQSAAPAWDLAARALGLALVETERVAAALPYLRIYVESRQGAPDAHAFGRELDRYEREQAARAAEFERVRPRLGKEELALGIRKGYALLEPCLARARDKRLLAVGVDTLYLSFRISKSGGVTTSQLEGPNPLLMTEPAECIERAVLAWRFPPYSEGSEVTAKRVPIRVRGAPPPQTETATAASIGGTGGTADSIGTGASTASAQLAAESFDEPTFATCERPAEDISRYMSGRTAAIAACLEAERRRNPNAWPDSLPISFVIDTLGPVRNVSLHHRYFRDGPLAACIGQALAGSFGPSSGADCPAEFAIDLHAFTRGR